MAPTYKLTYFNIRAVAEPIRFLLSYGDIEYEDVRIEFDDWPAVKHNYPNGQVPVLEIDGKLVFQSCAICRYLARKLGLAGDDDYDAMLIDAAVDTMTDIRLEIKNNNMYFEKDKELKAKKKELLLKTTLPPFFDTLEKQVKENDGYFIKEKLTWADLYLAAIHELFNFAMECDVLEPYPNLKSLVEKVFALPNIKRWVEKRPKSDL